MKLANIIVVCFSTLTIACGVDVTDPQAGYFDDHTDKSGSQTYNNYGGSVTVINNQGSSYTVASANAASNSQVGTTKTSGMRSFGKELAYIRMSKTSSGADMVMKNSSDSPMSVYVNFELKCLVNGKTEYEITNTRYVSLRAFEQSSITVTGSYYSMNSITCAGNILSVTDGDVYGNFQAWTGNYPISL